MIRKPHHAAAWRPAALVIGLVCIAGLASPGSAAAPLQTLRVVFRPQQSWGSLFIADKEGFFARQGIRIEWVPFAGAAEATVPISQGQIDVGAGSVSAALFNAVAHGERIRVVADKGHVARNNNAATSLIVRKDLAGTALRSLADLKGRRIAVNVTGGISHYMIAQTLAKAGLTLSDVEVVRLPTSASQLAALTGRSVDGVIFSEPWITMAREQGVGVLFVGSSQVILGQHIGLILFGPNLLDRNPEMGVRFLVAYLQGLQVYARGPTARNLRTVSEYTQLDEDSLRKGGWLPMYADGHIDAPLLRRFQDWLYAAELTEVRSPISAVVDTAMLERAQAIVRH